MKMRQVVGVLALVGVGILIPVRVKRFQSKGVQNFEKEKYLGKWYEIARLILIEKGQYKR
jgi:apolipoprotein D and lipocalin family protein